MALKAFYNDPDFDYRKYWLNRSYEDQAERLALARFFRFIPQNQLKNFGKLLDIGAGFGRLATYYLPHIHEAVLLEPAQKLIRQGKKYLINFKNFEYEQGNIENLAAWPEQFQVILLIRVLHHLKNLQGSFTAINKVLAPGGFLILEVPNKFNLLQVLRQLGHGNWRYFSRQPIDRRSLPRRTKEVISFRNYSPKTIVDLAKKERWILRDKLSVSNFRQPLVKRILGTELTLRLESLAQRPLAHFNFGPSIFFLFQKPKN